MNIVAAIVSCGFFILSLRRPSLSIGLSLAMIPVWYSPIVAGTALYPGVMACIGSIMRAIATHRKSAFLRSASDNVIFALAAFFFLLTILAYVRYGFAFAVSTPIAYWIIPFVAGFLLIRTEREEALLRVLAALGPLVAAIAILEAALGLRYGDLWPVVNSGARELANYQYRGGRLTAEAGWGHGIALAGFLSASIVALVRRKVSTFTLFGVALCAAGVVATGSRSGFVSLAVAIAVVIWMKTHRAIGGRIYAAAWFLLVAAVVYGSIAVSSSVAADYQSSSAYRSILITKSVENSHLFGPADYFTVGPTGMAIAGLRYIDSTAVQSLVSAGWIATACLVLLYALIVFTFARSELVILALLIPQIPLLFAQGFLGQHQVLFWLLIGVQAGGRFMPQKVDVFETRRDSVNLD